MTPSETLGFIIQRYEAFNLKRSAIGYAADGKLYVAPHLILVSVYVNPDRLTVEFRFKLYNVNVVTTIGIERFELPQYVDDELFHVIRQLVLAQIKFPPIGEYNPHGETA